MSSASDKPISELDYAWSKYRSYAYTSQKLKRDLQRGRLSILLLSLSGAILAVACQSLNQIANYTDIAAILGYLSAICLGGTTFLGKELVKPEFEKSWIRARSLAEALKSQVFLFITQTTPYDTKDRASLLYTEVNNLISDAKDIITVKISHEQETERLPPPVIDNDEYIQMRLKDQLNYYRNSKQINVDRMTRIKYWGLALGSIAVILGAIGSTGWSAGWVAVISTALASISAYAYAGRYQYLIISYQSTANRLESLLASRDRLGENFVILCEQAISIENSSWMSKLIEDKPSESDKPSDVKKSKGQQKSRSEVPA